MRQSCENQVVVFLQLDKIKRGEGLLKDHDERLLANTYDPDDLKSVKSNKRREQEQREEVRGECVKEFYTLKHALTFFLNLKFQQLFFV